MKWFVYFHIALYVGGIIAAVAMINSPKGKPPGAVAITVTFELALIIWAMALVMR